MDLRFVVIALLALFPIAMAQQEDGRPAPKGNFPQKERGLSQKLLREREDRHFQRNAVFLERLLHPDLSLSFPLIPTFFPHLGDRNQLLPSKFLHLMPYRGISTYLTKESHFASRFFLGIKNPGWGSKDFSSNAHTPFIKLAVSTKFSPFPTKKIPSTNAVYFSANKSAAAGEDKTSLLRQPFLVQGSSQEDLNSISEKISKKMSIDDVRELLNRSR